ncbi:uncharacterized protein SSYIS1_04640 [Serratia symbiotica]|uniref:Uncharacterized protein n=1 Tax=Serratia symbiotica TaxID=138074 RepID=A0A455VFN8_9GAMM|nr:uncharacterized protein SSYIS1_04640 [Serratia symbiotica]
MSAQALFKSVPDRFVAALPLSCNANYLGYNGKIICCNYYWPSR